MKGRTPSAQERRFMDAVGKLPCIACLQDGIRNDHVLIHHIDGRTKLGAHTKVLPLCAAHHQHDDADPMERVGVHPYKARFEREYGRQESLLEQVRDMVGEVA